MKVDDKNEYTVDQNFKDKKVIGFELEKSATAHLIGVLTDIYENQIRAFIREYSTNAWDSHVAAGNKNPIEITLPNSLNPTFKVQDFGVGLSVADLENIYSKYGASTKRETNDATGMLGLGCKSALTYCSQFNIVAVKDGIKAKVSIGKNTEGVGEITVVSEEQTTDPNGVSIIIPVTDITKVKEEAEDFFSFWPEGRVLVNGKEPEKIKPKVELDNFKIVYKQYDYYATPTDYIYMGGVTYPVKLEHNLPREYYVVAEVDIGDIHFTPSREGLLETTKTKATVDKLKEDFDKKFTAYIQDQLKAAKTKSEFLGVIKKLSPIWGGKIDLKKLKFDGKELPGKYTVSVDYGAPHEKNLRTIANEASWGETNQSRKEHYGIDFLNWRDYFWVENHNQKFHKAHREKIKYWIENESSFKFANASGYYSRRIVLHYGKIPKHVREWLPKDQIADFEKDIKPLKLKTNKYTPSDKYDCYTPTGVRNDVPSDEISDSKNIFYVRKTEYYNNGTVKKYLADNLKDFYLAILPENRLKKFKRLHPEAKPIKTYLQEEFEKWEDSLSDIDKLAIKDVSKGVSNKLSYLKDCKIDDPKVKKLLKQVADLRDSKTKKKTLSKYSTWNDLGIRTTVGEKSWDEYNHLFNEYPLIEFVVNSYSSNKHKEDVTLYINAKYKEVKATNA